MPETVDLLQIKIEKAKSKLPEETLAAIAAVPWQAAILKMRETKGYSFEQLEDLQTETELLLCGLVSPTDYPKQLAYRMKISTPQANELVNEMNKEVFSKIKEELIKIMGQKRDSTASVNSELPRNTAKEDAAIFGSAGIEITNSNDKKMWIPEKPEVATGEKPAPAMLHVMPKEEIHPVMAQKLSGSFQATPVTTEHSLEKITKTGASPDSGVRTDKPHTDPYRELPE